MSNSTPRAALPPLPPPAVKAGDYAGPPGEGASENYWDAEQVEQIRRETVHACADCIPTSWLDSLLTGPDAIAASDTEALLLAVKARILALLPMKPDSVHSATADAGASTAPLPALTPLKHESKEN